MECDNGQNVFLCVIRCCTYAIVQIENNDHTICSWWSIRKGISQCGKAYAWINSPARSSEHPRWHSFWGNCQNPNAVGWTRTKARRIGGKNWKDDDRSRDILLNCAPAHAEVQGQEVVPAMKWLSGCYGDIMYQLYISLALHPSSWDVRVYVIQN